MRVVQPLRQPGETAKDSGAIQLHMPGKSSARAPIAPATRTVTAAPRPAAPAMAPRPAPAPAKRVAATPAPAPSASASGYNPGYGALGTPAGSAAGLNLGEPPKQLAKAEPAPKPSTVTVTEPGLTKRSVILFAAGAPDPAQSALGSIKFLAGDLNASMTGAGSRIQLLAYGGDKGDKGSDARRLSLKRALAIRQVLIDDGVPAERIDVRAMGGADDGGPADRVDVFVKV
jgi:outer membrane protein OmpA-like peptidoglycan-associated protein